MRLIHTSDWHLGRTLFGHSLVADQAYILDQLVDLVRHLRVNALVVVGDIFDRSSPTSEAVAVLEDVLGRLVLDCSCQVVLIGGQHDRLDRLGLTSRLIRGLGVQVVTSLAQSLTPIKLGSVELWAIPYLDAHSARSFTGNDEIHDSLGASRAILRHLHGRIGAVKPALFAYTLIDDVEPAGSERRLAPLRAKAVERELVSGYSYVGLGYVHNPLELRGTTVRYSGAPLKYSFQEVGKPKSVAMVELAEDPVRVETFPLNPRHDLRWLRGKVENLMTDHYKGSRSDYLRVSASDREPTAEEAQFLRERFPNLVFLEGPPSQAGLLDFRELELEELFGRFYKAATGTPLDEAQKQELRGLLVEDEA